MPNERVIRKSGVRIERVAAADSHGGYTGAWYAVDLYFPQHGFVSEGPRFAATLAELRALRAVLTEYLDLQPEAHA